MHIVGFYSIYLKKKKKNNKHFPNTHNGFFNFGGAGSCLVRSINNFLPEFSLVSFSGSVKVSGTSGTSLAVIGWFQQAGVLTVQLMLDDITMLKYLVLGIAC